jgi:DinB superfamily
MNPNDIVKYGNLTVLKTIEGLPPADWHAQGVCGWWSVKDILAHLASFEQVLVEILENFLVSGGENPTLKQFIELKGDDFNATQVNMRKNWAVDQVMQNYRECHTRVVDLLKKIEPDQLRKMNVLPWYGAEYDLEDFIVYSFYGHKREHSAQIAVFRDQIKR